MELLGTSVVVLKLHGTLAQNTGSTLVHKLAVLTLLDEALVDSLCCILTMILVLGRAEVAKAHHGHHGFLGGLPCILLNFHLLLLRSLSFLSLLGLSLLHALHLLICPGAALLFL